MSTPINAMVSGTFDTAATLKPIDISLPTGYDSIEITNLTDVVTTGSSAIIFAKSIPGSLPGYARLSTNSGVGFALDESVIIADGITPIVNATGTALGAAVAITGITQANPAVAATATTLTAGDVIRVYGTTDMHQISGMDFTVGTVVAGVSMELAYLNSAGFADPASAGFYRQVPFDQTFYPKARSIVGITAAAQAVVTLSVTHGYKEGEQVRMFVPVGWGMTQMNGLIATIVAVNTTTNTITLDVNSSGFTAFAFPTSAVTDAGVSFPQVCPIGEKAAVPYGNLYDDAKINMNFSGVRIGTGCLEASCHYSYIARKGLSI
jgi:hypothetical protein